jgi:hypothetical protein
VTSSNFTVSISGTTSGNVTVTPASTNPGDVISPSTVTLNSGTQSATFTVLRTTAGTSTISATNNGGLTNPSTINYVVTATALTAGAVKYSKSTKTSITMAEVTPAAFGQGPYTHQWYSGSTVNFSVGSGSTLLAGQTSNTLNLTGLPRRSYAWYIRRVTDGVGNTADTVVIGAAPYPTVNIGLHRIGQSLTANAASYTAYITDSITDLYPAIVDVNSGVGGSKTADWQPAGTNYVAAINAANAAFVGTYDQIIVELEFGINDASNSVSSATFQSQLQAIITAILTPGAYANSAPVSIYLLAPSYVSGTYSTTVLDQLRQYIAVIASLANNTTIYYEGDDFYVDTLNHPEEKQGDGVHYLTTTVPGGSQTGIDRYRKRRADSFVRTWKTEGLLSGSGGGGGGSGRGRSTRILRGQVG